jgi:hypothetical protein
MGTFLGKDGSKTEPDAGSPDQTYNDSDATSCHSSDKTAGKANSDSPKDSFHTPTTSKSPSTENKERYVP